jgi:hypothetical protein
MPNVGPIEFQIWLPGSCHLGKHIYLKITIFNFMISGINFGHWGVEYEIRLCSLYNDVDACSRTACCENMSQQICPQD